MHILLSSRRGTDLLNKKYKNPWHNIFYFLIFYFIRIFMLFYKYVFFYHFLHDQTKKIFFIFFYTFSTFFSLNQTKFMHVCLSNFNIYLYFFNKENVNIFLHDFMWHHLDIFILHYKKTRYKTCLAPESGIEPK